MQVVFGLDPFLQGPGLRAEGGRDLTLVCCPLLGVNFQLVVKDADFLAVLLVEMLNSPAQVRFSLPRQREEQQVLTGLMS